MEVAIALMRIDIEIVDAGRIEGRAAALETVNNISLGEQDLRQIGADLSRNTSDQCGFAYGILAFNRDVSP